MSRAPADTSKIMRKIRSSNTKAEVLLRKSLWHAGVRYRKNYKKLPGSPDIAITKNKLAIFIDGEFWHGRNWETEKQKIKSNQAYWLPKIERTMERDLANNEALISIGFTVIRLWENEVLKDLQGCIDKIIKKAIK
jgi:DNA mismatch endonuclease (patch repair protein)